MDAGSVGKKRKRSEERWRLGHDVGTKGGYLRTENPPGMVAGGPPGEPSEDRQSAPEASGDCLVLDIP
jgi:hypothetical protein